MPLRLDQSKHFAGGRLVEAGIRFDDAYCFQHVSHGYARHLGGQHRLFPGGGDETLRTEVVHFVGARFFHGADKRREIGQVAVNQFHLLFYAQLAQAPQCIGAAPCDQPEYPIALFKQQFSKIRAILSGNSGDQGMLSHFLNDAPNK